MKHVDYVLASGYGFVALRIASREFAEFLGGVNRNHIPFVFYTGDPESPLLTSLSAKGAHIGRVDDLITIVSKTHIEHKTTPNQTTNSYARHAVQELKPGVPFQARDYGDKLKIPVYPPTDGTHPTDATYGEIRDATEFQRLLREAIPAIEAERIKNKRKLKGILTRFLPRQR